MNEFQRKYLDILAQSDYISSVARPGKKILNIDYYAYNARIGTDAVPVAATGGVGQAQVQIQADSDFVLSYISGGAQQTANDTINSAQSILVQMTDTGSGKKYFNQPTLLPIMAGQGGYPFMLPAPRVLNPNTILQIDVQNLMNISFVGIFFAFHGARIFYAS